MHDALEKREAPRTSLGGLSALLVFAGLMSLSAAGGRVAGYRNGVGERQDAAGLSATMRANNRCVRCSSKRAGQSEEQKSD